MKLVIRFSLILISILLLHNAVAAEEITGTWQGKLVVAPETELRIQFVISRDGDGSYTVLLNSPDQGAIKDIKANSVTYASGRLTMEVAELSGSYDGVVRDRKIEGSWTQEGSSMPLDLVPYVKPTLSAEDKEKLLGSWNGKLEFPGGSLTIVYRFEMGDGGEFKGFLDSPDQGGFGIPVSDMEMEDGTLTVTVSRLRAEYKGKIAGDEIVGEFKQGPQLIPLTLKRGEYKAKTHNLDLSEEDKETLMGSWHGEVETPAGAMTAVYRFEKSENGEFIGFADSPDRGVAGVPVTGAEMKDGTVTIRVTPLQAEYKGKISGDEIVGELTQGPQSFPLTLKKGEYKPPVYNLSFSKEAMARLSGKWQGKLTVPGRTLTIVFRFEPTEGGKALGFFDSPDESANGIPITDASFDNGSLTLKIKRLQAEYIGQLSDAGLTGEWKQGGGSFPLSLTR